MLKGLALTPPVIGRIAIGKVVEKNGKRLPEKDDEFTITSQLQTPEGWLPHPVDRVLRQWASVDKDNQGGTKQEVKLRKIPIQLLFSDPDLNLRANYSLFDRHTGRPVCVGDGEMCKRMTDSGMQSLPCPSTDFCSFAQGNCKPYGRLHVQIDTSVLASNTDVALSSATSPSPEPSPTFGSDKISDHDALGSFVFRTTGFNSIRTLSTRLRYLQSVSGNMLATLPLEMRLRGKSTAQSYRAPIYYVDITVRSGVCMTEAISQARMLHETRLAAGFDQVALDEAARLGFANGAFDESEEDGASVVEEFYPEPSVGGRRKFQVEHSAKTDVPKQGLADKLSERAALLSPDHA